MNFSKLLRPLVINFFCLFSLIAPLAALAESSEGPVRLHVVDDPSDLNEGPGKRAYKFDLEDPRQLTLFRAEIKKLLQLSELQKKVKKDAEKSLKLAPRFAYEIKSGGRKALEETLSLLDTVERRQAGSVQALHQIRLMMASFQHNLAYPIKKNYQLLPDAPYYIAKGFKHNTIKSGDPVESLVRQPGVNDSSRWDPKPSTFWQPKANDGQVNMRVAFGRKSVPDFEKPICTYIEAKDGWGAHPGFTVNCGQEDNYKYKIGDEIFGGPFNTRLYWLLGYNVSSIDGVQELKVAYDRRILSEFHSRKHLQFDIRFLFFKLYRKVVTNYEDPFDFVVFAKLKDGSKIPGKQLKKLLFKTIPAGDPKKPEYKRPETMPGNYREDFEAQIEYLAFVPGAMAHDNDDVKSIGPWKYDEFGAEDLREVRAAQIISAWVGNYNMRWENTRLNFVKVGKKNWQLKHFFSDVGTGFGAAHDLANMNNSRLNEMRWRVSEPTRNGVELKGFNQNMPNPAFDNLTLEDARWMLRKLAGITEKQIWDSLLATEMSAAELRVAFEKLLSRRAHMIRDFGLGREFPEIVKRKFNTQFSYTPVAGDGPRWDRQKVVKGVLVTIKK